jgi:hypothetical protein
MHNVEVIYLRPYVSVPKHLNEFKSNLNGGLAPIIRPLRWSQFVSAGVWNQRPCLEQGSKHCVIGVVR